MVGRARRIAKSIANWEMCEEIKTKKWINIRLVLLEVWVNSEKDEFGGIASVAAAHNWILRVVIVKV